MVELIVALAVGLGVGVVVGALGAGGGILSVPVLVYLLGQEPHAASAGSLVIVGLTALVSLIPRSREGHVRWRDGLVFGVLSSVGTVLGSRLSVLVDPRTLMLLFSVLLVAVGVMMLRKAFPPCRWERRRGRRGRVLRPTWGARSASADRLCHRDRLPHWLLRCGRRFRRGTDAGAGTRIHDARGILDIAVGDDHRFGCRTGFAHRHQHQRRLDGGRGLRTGLDVRRTDWCAGLAPCQGKHLDAVVRRAPAAGRRRHSGFHVAWKLIRQARRHDKTPEPNGLNRTPIVGLKKFRSDDWRCGSSYAGGSEETLRRWVPARGIGAHQGRRGLRIACPPACDAGIYRETMDHVV